MSEELVVVGGGKMGEALVLGLHRAGVAGAANAGAADAGAADAGAADAGAALTIVEADPARRRQLEAHLPGLAIVAAIPDNVHEAVIAVKPPDVETVARGLAGAGARRVLSIAAGVTLSSLESWLSPEAAVIRAMPNTPALVGAGASAIAGGRHATADDLGWAAAILEAVGTVVTLPEAALDAVTGLSGSGPAYVFLVAEALIDAGVLVGLARPTARQLAIQTLLGAARLLDETQEEPAALRAAVTSPGGTTAAGLRALEAAGLRSAILEAVAAATERSSQLGAG